MVSNRSKLVRQELYSESTVNIRGFIVSSKKSTSRDMNAIKTKLPDTTKEANGFQ